MAARAPIDAVGSLSSVAWVDPRTQVSEIQRSRLLTAAVSEIGERGYAATTVAHITSRARVSRRTFYDQFADREACLAAVFTEVRESIATELAAARLAGRPWRERVRGGVEAILGFFDREPGLARVCVVQSSQAGSAVLRLREEALEHLIDLVDGGRVEKARGAEVSRLTAEGVVGAALAIVHRRLAHEESGALTALTGELTGMIVLPYQGAAAARREQQRPVIVSVTVASRQASWPQTSLQNVGMRLTYRTVRILEGARERPGASNRELSGLAGIQDQGQVSKLLARLQRLGLMVNSANGHATGEPNQWSLTASGEDLVRSLRVRAAICGESPMDLGERHEALRHRSYQPKGRHEHR